MMPALPGPAPGPLLSIVVLVYNTAPWLREWANFAERLGRLAEARELLRETLRREPAYADAALDRGRVLRLMGLPERGERWLRTYKERPRAAAGPDDSPYRRAVLAFDPAAFDAEIARCRADAKKRHPR